MSEYNVRINAKTSTGYDQLYPQTKSDIVNFDKSNSNLTSDDVESAIKELDTISNTNKTNIGTLSSLSTDAKTNIVSAINEVDSHVNSAQSTANTANSTANTANSTANTNKTNIGTLSFLKTSIKTSIVNAINSLYDSIIGKTLKTLNEVSLATSKGYYVDALAVKELNTNFNNVAINGTDEWQHTIKFPNGTMIKTTYVVHQVSVSTPWGNGYISQELYGVTFPDSNIPFVGRPMEIFCASPLSIDDDNVCSIMPRYNCSSTKSSSFYLFTPATVTNRQWYVKVIAIGRWK